VGTESSFCPVSVPDRTVASEAARSGSIPEQGKVCRVCKGSGIDPKLHFKYTSGGHDDRSCEACNGEGIRPD
jgi:DnaJ-class molecular chaperone